MSLTHDQIQERIDRTINNHQFSCQTIGYNIYILETPIEDFTLPIKEWTPETRLHNQSYIISNDTILDDSKLKKFISVNSYSVYRIKFENDQISIQGPIIV